MRQIKNMLATLLLSQGVPMIVVGDECRRTQKGNNNAYCQDNEISLVRLDAGRSRTTDLVRFALGADQVPPQQPTVRREHFLTGKPKFEGDLPDVSWFSALGTAVDWHGDDSTLIALLKRSSPSTIPKGIARDVLMLVNATQRAAGVHPAAGRQGHALAAVHRHGRRSAVRRLSRPRRPAAAALAAADAVVPLDVLFCGGVSGA